MEITLLSFTTFGVITNNFFVSTVGTCDIYYYIYIQGSIWKKTCVCPPGTLYS